MDEMQSSMLELAGRVANAGTYSKYYNDKYEANGSPKGYDLETIFNSPQQYIDEIYHLSKYYYHKYGIIMRVVNIIRDFGVCGYKLNYPVKDKKVREVIDNYNKRIGLNQILRDIIFELALSGNCAGYDRDGKRIDIYPVTKIEVSPLIYNNKPVLMYKNDFNISNFDGMLPRNLVKKLELSYPKEVAIGIKQNKDMIVLDVDNTFYLKTNSSRYEPYGVPFILTAFDELAHKTILKEAERSTATGIIDKILKIGIGDKDHKPKQPEIDFYNALFDGKKGSLKVTVPYFVNPEWIEPDTAIFGKEKFEQVDLDILNALGVSLTLIRGEGGGNYSEGFIAITGLIKTIESLREGIPEILKEFYEKELERNNLKPEHAPVFEFTPVEIDKSSKLELVKWLFSTAGLPYEVLYQEAGYDYMSVKLVREQENEEKTEETFKSRMMMAQEKLNEEGQPGQPGRPTTPLTERKSDKKQSNNAQPRPSTTK
jgi:hypothetical protein